MQYKRESAKSSHALGECEDLENPELTEQFLDFDLKKLQLTLLKIHASFILENRGRMLIELSLLDNFLRRNEISFIANLNKRETIKILIQLSANSFGSILHHSLSCLSILSKKIPQLLNEMIENSFEISIMRNLQATFPDQCLVFQWVGNILYNFPNFPIFEKIDISILYKSSKSYLKMFQSKQNKYIPYMFHELSRNQNLPRDVVFYIFKFFNFILKLQNPTGMKYVLHSIHLILTTNDSLSPEEISELCQQFYVSQKVSRILELNTYDTKNGLALNRKSAFSFLIICGLFEHNIFDNQNEIPLLLDMFFVPNQQQWFLKNNLECLHRILKICPNEIATSIWNFPIYEFLFYEIENGQTIVRLLSAMCLLRIALKIDESEVEKIIQPSIISCLFDLLNVEDNDYCDEFGQFFPFIIDEAVKFERTNEMLEAINFDEFEGILQIYEEDNYYDPLYNIRQTLEELIGSTDEM